MLKFVVFRVDSSIETGSGHFMRCFTFAKYLKKFYHCDIVFVCRFIGDKEILLLHKEGFEIYSLNDVAVKDGLKGYAQWLGVTEEEDAAETISILNKLPNIDMLIVDHYGIGEKWEKIVKQQVGKLFVIDDLANRRHFCDYILDQNFYLDYKNRYKGLVQETTVQLLGPKFVLLREEFYQVKASDVRNRVFVNYGGVDKYNETEKAIKALSFFSNLKVDIVVGYNNPHKEMLRNLSEKYSYNFYCDVNNIAEMLSRTRLAIGSGGTSIWERMFIDVPSIVTSIAENQEKICEDCYQSGFFCYLGKSQDVGVYELRHAIEYNLKNKVRYNNLFSREQEVWVENLFT